MADLENNDSKDISDNAGSPPSSEAVPPRQSPFKPLKPKGADETQQSLADGAPTVRRTIPNLRRVGENAPEKPVPAATPVAPEATAAAAFEAGVGEAPQGVPVPFEKAAKHKTTRVDLPEMAEGGGGSGEFRTVRLRPAGTPQPGGEPLPDGFKPLTPSQIQASKSKTSRISLEAALGAADAPPEPGSPKTIRLKRPTEMRSGATGPLTGGVSPSPTAKLPTQALGATVMQHSMTAKLPTQTLTEAAAPEGDSEASPTRRKTIKIKRPSAAVGIKINAGGTAAAASDEEAAAGEDMQGMALPAGMRPIVAAGEDSVNVAFVIAAVAAAVVTLGVIWILAAQAFGPDSAVTGYTRAWGADITPPPGLTTLN